LIFGGAGFVGSNWANFLLKNTDAKIHIFDNLSRRGVRQNLRWLQTAARGSERLKVTVGDVRDAALVNRAVQTATEIYHFAAQVAVTTSVDDPRSDFEVNVGGTLNILEAARKTGRHPFVLFTSTNKVYGNMAGRSLICGPERYTCTDRPSTTEDQPLDFHSPYGCSKGAADQYVHDYSRIYGLPTVVFRMSCIAGAHQFGNEDQGWVAHFLYSALKNRPIVVYGDGKQVRDVLCVDDLIRAFEAVRTHVNRTAGEIYNVGGTADNSVSLIEIMKEIERLTAKKMLYTSQPPRPGDQLFYVTDCGKLRRHVGWSPQISVRETLQRMWTWWRENRDSLLPEEDVQPLPAALSRLHVAPEVAS
jgi:CDP-paratose 2-epimerase